VDPVTSVGTLGDVLGQIQPAREDMARMLGTTLTLLYWEVEYRIRTEVLQEKRADCGATIVVTLSRHLEGEFGSAFEERNLRRMVQFAEISQTASFALAAFTIGMVAPWLRS
jgi:hypothetical protein